MSEHMTEWLNAYMDGELKGRRLHQVEEHLAGCDVCRAELESLRNLSAVLHEIPTPEFISSERFAAQVNLRLPHEMPKATNPTVREIGWWMIPVSLLMIWFFLGALTWMNNALSTASGLGLLHNAPIWLVSNSSNEAIWSNALSRIGLLGGTNLEWAKGIESFTRNVLPQFIWHISIAILYLTWITIWWARQKHQGHGQLPNAEAGSRSN